MPLLPSRWWINYIAIAHSSETMLGKMCWHIICCHCSKVVRELYLPESGMWLADYPFVDRNTFLDISLRIEEQRRGQPWGQDQVPPAAAAAADYPSGWNASSTRSGWEAEGRSLMGGVAAEARGWPDPRGSGWQAPVSGEAKLRAQSSRRNDGWNENWGYLNFMSYECVALCYYDQFGHAVIPSFVLNFSLLVFCLSCCRNRIPTPGAAILFKFWWSLSHTESKSEANPKPKPFFVKIPVLVQILSSSWFAPIKVWWVRFIQSSFSKERKKCRKRERRCLVKSLVKMLHKDGDST